MGRARRARKVAQVAAYGGGGLAAGVGALGALAYGVLKAEAKIARRVVGQPFDAAPQADGVYGAGVGVPVDLVVLGDSSAAGLGADLPSQTPGAIIATGLAALTGRMVRLTNAAVVGAESEGLEMQVINALDQVERPDLAVIMVGANDVTHRINTAIAVRHLDQAVRRLQVAGAQVVVGTCPDLGTLEPVPQPLRLLARRWSRDMAAAQTVAVVEAGARTVSLGDLLGPEFYASPSEMFSRDRFHPSAAGYARAAAALLPSVVAALESAQVPAVEEPVPDRRRGEGVGPLAVAAREAVRDPGAEVHATEIAGQDRGPRGRWAVLLRRGPARPDTATGSDPVVEEVPMLEDREDDPTLAAPSPGDGAGPAAGAGAAGSEADDTYPGEPRRHTIEGR